MLPIQMSNFAQIVFGGKKFDENIISFKQMRTCGQDKDLFECSCQETWILPEHILKYDNLSYVILLFNAIKYCEILLNLKNRFLNYLDAIK